jgi:hypothetical protein
MTKRTFAERLLARQARRPGAATTSGALHKALFTAVVGTDEGKQASALVPAERDCRSLGITAANAENMKGS